MASKSNAEELIRRLLVESGLSPQQIRALLAGLHGGMTVGQFYSEYGLVRRLSRAQRRAYGHQLFKFVKEYEDITLGELTAFLVEEFALAEYQRGIAAGQSGSYQHEHAVRAVRWLLKQAIAARLIDTNVGLGVALMPRPESARRPLTGRELTGIFDVAAHSGLDPELDLLILRVLRETAARRGAVIKIRLGLLDPEVGAIRLLEKNNRRPLVPASRDLLHDLRTHAISRGADPQDPAEPVLRYRNGTPLTSRRFDALFSRIHARHQWARDLGVSPHWIRYTTLTDIRKVAGKEIAKAYAGHRSHDPTDIYTLPDFDELKAAHRAVFFPGDDKDPQTQDAARRWVS